MMLTNKHVVIAMIVAPVLAVIAWLGVGQFTGETPQPAVAGQSYPLVEKSNCRYPSGACDLVNEDFRVGLVYQQGDSGAELVLRSSLPLEGVVLGVAVSGEDATPGIMRASDEEGREWRLAMNAMPGPEQRIHLVAMASGSSYFADAATLFLQPKDN